MLLAFVSMIAGYLVWPFSLLRGASARSRERRLSLLLLRHAEAVRGGEGPDAQRPLTQQGSVDAQRLGGAIREHALVPDVIVTSPARRAVETATLVARAAASVGPVRTDSRLYGAGVDGIGAVVRAIPEDVARALVVGHDPAISRFAAQVGGVHAGLPPGGLVELAIEIGERLRRDDADIRGRVVRLWRPREARERPSGSSRAPDVRSRSKWFVAAADERVIDAASRAIEERLDDVLSRLALAADADAVDAEAVRKLRVATRRAEAALRAFRGVLPRRATTRVREHLRAVRKATNAARDADVMSVRLGSLATAELLALLHANRQATQNEIRALCRRLSGDAALSRSVDALQRKVRNGSAAGRPSSETFGAWARARLARSAERFLAEGSPDFADVDRLHDLRLRTKKLRYEVEILAGVFPPALRSEIYPLLSELQDRLGEVSDGAVVLKRLRQLDRPMSASLPAASFAVLAREADALLSRSRDELAQWWTPERAERLKNEISGLL